MTNSNDTGPVHERRTSRGAIALFIIFCLVLAGVLVYAFSDNGANALSSGMTAASNGQGVAGPSGKGNLIGQQGTNR
jgi:hypothetical protein